MVDALLKWIGNKSRFASVIVSYMPDKFNDYYEPFLGSGAVMAELISDPFHEFNHAYGSDILPFLIDIFNITKDSPNELKDYYENVINKYNEDPQKVYDEVKDRFNEKHNPFDFLILSRTCYSGVIRFRKRDGYMSTPRGPHKPIPPFKFAERVDTWNKLLVNASFCCESYINAMDKAKPGDLVYCDPPYTHSQGIIYGAQDFNIEDLWTKIDECKKRDVKVMLSINGMRDSKKKDISITPPEGLFARKELINCGISMIDRLQNTGKQMKDKKVDDQLLLTW